MSLTADLRAARKAKAHGAHYSLRIVLEARRAGVPLSLAFGLVSVESNFENVFGHDDGGPFPGAAVTHARVLALIHHVEGGGTSNGVGLTQLTWLGFIKAAERAGGAHLPKYQLRVGLDHLAKCVDTYGTRKGLSVYNAGHPYSRDGRRYATKVLASAAYWHKVLK